MKVFKQLQQMHPQFSMASLFSFFLSQNKLKDIPLYIADDAQPGGENEVALFCVFLFLGLHRRYSKRFRWFAILSAVFFLHSEIQLEYISLSIRFKRKRDTILNILRLKTCFTCQQLLMKLERPVYPLRNGQQNVAKYADIISVLYTKYIFYFSNLFHSYFIAFSSQC